MASATTTYGKKKGLLKSLGSHRRQKNLAGSLIAKKQEPATLSMYAPRETASPPLQADQHPKHNRVQALADALLDETSLDAIYQHNAQQLLAFRAKPVIHPQQKQEHPIRGAQISLPRLIPGFEPSFPAADTAVLWDVPRPRKEMPKDTKHFLTRAATTRERPASKNEKHRSRRPLSASAGRHFHPNVASKDQIAAGSGLMAADEINNKVSAMLAATDALKPTQAAISATRRSRISPARVLSKVSCALGRLHSRHSAESTKAEKESDAPPVLDQIDPLSFSDIAFDESTAVWDYAISSIEIRLNEGDNLNKRKVQKIVGGQIVRKPVADDGKSLRSGKSTDGPFSDRGRCHVTSTNARQAQGNNGHTGPVTPKPCNPFDFEKAFDSDLEDSILDSSPLGSSTPRLTIHKFPTSTSSNSLTGKRSRTGQDWGAGRTDSLYSEPEKIPSATSPRREADLPKRLQPYNLGGDFEGLTRGGKRAKKHPSPSKGALEDLGMAFRQYDRLRQTEVDQDDLDELAQNYSPPAPLLVQRDLNRIVRARTLSSEVDSSNPRSKAHGARRTRFPGPAELRELRLAPRYRPPVPNIDDDDELQQHPSCYQMETRGT